MPFFVVCPSIPPLPDFHPRFELLQGDLPSRMYGICLATGISKISRESIRHLWIPDSFISNSSFEDLFEGENIDVQSNVSEFQPPSHYVKIQVGFPPFNPQFYP